MTPPSPRSGPTPVVIGVGNEWRRDDGAGWAAARLVARGLAGAELVLTVGEPARLLDAWDGAEVALVIDAVRTGAAPGTLHVLAVSDLLRGAPSARAAHGSHALGLEAAVQLGEALGRLPGQLAVVGIEGSDFGEGVGLSPAVASAIPAAVAESCRAVLALLERAAEPGTRSPW